MTVDRPGASDRLQRPPARRERPPQARRLLAAAAGLLVGLFCVLLGPAGPASAHAALVASDPAGGTIVPDAPNKVTLTFSESVQLITGKIQVLAPDGSRADQGDPQAAGGSVVIPLRSGGGRGTYLVSYRVVSADSHPVAGSLTFSVGAASTPPTETAGADSVDPVVRALIPVGKYLGYAGLVLLVGPVLVLALLWPHRLSRRGPSRLVWTGVGLVLGSTLLALWLQAPYTTGSGLFGVSGDDLRDVLGSTFGAVMLVGSGSWWRPASCCARCCAATAASRRSTWRCSASWAWRRGHLAAHRAPDGVPGGRGLGGRRRHPPRRHGGLARRPGHAGRVPAAPGQRARAGRDPAHLVALGGDPRWPRWSSPARCRR
ncbi:hypothetical protein GCM10020358_14150 [Amorphoplanes nipponensis]